MRPVLLIDFGSTYTKVTAVDADEGKLIGTAASYTTVQTDINNGLNDALKKLEKVTGKLEFKERYAASSAAGGLRMLSSGLVPELTSEAAKCASLGAGAKVLKTYAFELNEDDAEEIKRIKPDSDEICKCSEQWRHQRSANIGTCHLHPYHCLGNSRAKVGRC